MEVEFCIIRKQLPKKHVKVEKHRWYSIYRPFKPLNYMLSQSKLQNSFIKSHHEQILILKPRYQDNNFRLKVDFSQVSKSTALNMKFPYLYLNKKNVWRVSSLSNYVWSFVVHECENCYSFPLISLMSLSVSMIDDSRSEFDEQFANNLWANKKNVEYHSPTKFYATKSTLCYVITTYLNTVINACIFSLPLDNTTCIIFLSNQICDDHNLICILNCTLDYLAHVVALILLHAQLRIITYTSHGWLPWKKHRLSGP